MKFILASDHAGFKLRQGLATSLKSQGYEATEVGADSEQPYDYPLAADLAVPYLLDGRADFGVFVCGSGIGICIRANRYSGIRAAHCVNTKMATMARQHNHANVLCLGEREMGQDVAVRILETFIATDPDDAARHERRVKELDAAVNQQRERTTC